MVSRLVGILNSIRTYRECLSPACSIDNDAASFLRRCQSNVPVESGDAEIPLPKMAVCRFEVACTIWIRCVPSATSQIRIQRDVRMEGCYLLDKAGVYKNRIDAIVKAILFSS